jgi:hypothetical protein
MYSISIIDNIISIMSRTAPSAALSIAHVVLRILIVVNWVSGAAIFALLALSPNTEWIMSAFKLAPSLDTDRLIWGLRAIAFIGLCATPLNYLFLKRLLAIVETVRAGDPFVAANAARLRAIAWTLLTIQCLSIVIGGIAKAVSTPAHPLHIGGGFSVNGWLTVLLVFLLSQLFAEGTQMREDLAGTV